MTTSTALVVTGASKSYDGRSLWQDCAFTVDSGQMLALTGKSGSGKSTLLNCVGLLEKLDRGTITLDGQETTHLSASRSRRFRRDQLGYLFQNYALIESVDVFGNLDVAVGRVGLFRPRRLVAEYDEALSRVGLQGRGGDPVHLLSGGEQQRVAMARLLLRKPRVVLADEPTGALDEENELTVLNHLRGLANEGAVVLIATHSRSVADFCDDRLHLQGGSLAGIHPGVAQ